MSRESIPTIEPGQPMSAAALLELLVHPRTRSVAVWRLQKGREVVQILNADEVLSGEDVLPGFNCPVADLFV